MSSMLEQAIVDAAALREAALKNAEQSIIEKYAPQIKEAVNSLLDKEILNEQEGAEAAPLEPSSLDFPLGASPVTDPNQEVSLKISDEDQVYEFDLDQIKQQMNQEGTPEEDDMTSTDELAGDLGLSPDEGEEDLGGGLDLGGDALLNEIMDILSEVEDEKKFLKKSLLLIWPDNTKRHL